MLMETLNPTHSTRGLSLLFNGHFAGGPGLAGNQNVSILDFIRAKDDGSGGDNRSCKTCKTPVKSSPPTSIFFTGQMPLQCCTRDIGN